MASNPNLFLQDNFISRFFRIFGLCYQNTRKAGRHYQILQLYNDFNLFHDTSKVPLTSSQTGVLVSAVPSMRKSMAPLCKTRGAAQDQRRETTAFFRSPSVRIG